MRLSCLPVIVSLLLMLTLANQASAHFLWLVRTDTSAGAEVHVYFAEAAEPDDPDLLDRLQGLTVWQVTSDGAPKKLTVAKGEESLVAKLAAGPSDIFALSHEYGVTSRGEETFLLCYYAKTGPQLGDAAWSKVDCQKLLALDVVPVAAGDAVRVKVLFQGKPVAGAEVKVSGPLPAVTAATDESGVVEFKRGKPGRYSIRARHIETRSGKQGDKEFASVRHYSTLALNIDGADAARAEGAKPAEQESATPAQKEPAKEDSATATKVIEHSFPKLPQLVTSFGGAVCGDALYVYGGHTGDAHSYSHAEQGHILRRLDLVKPGKWEDVIEGPHLQGLALVSHGGRLYRVGGFTAKNAAGKQHDLWSDDDVASFTPGETQWRELPPLPEPRSSHDAAVLGDALYVVGGWQLGGQEESLWHATAWSLDLAAEKPKWMALPKPPFERRALAAAAHDGKLYVIGGMQHEGGPTTRVDVFDPAAGAWSQGPSIQGEPMEGFGCSAFAAGGELYVSTIRGNLQRLADDGKSWTVDRKLPTARFFHRMLPIADDRLIIVGGANMGIGKFGELELIEVGRTSTKE
jgi:N-acetylneuraminic acid mutarotase